MGEDMALPRLHYELPELAKKWEKTEKDLLQMAAAGALRLSVKHFGTGFYRDIDNGSDVEIVVDGYVQIDNDDCESILEFGCARMSSLIVHVSSNGKRVRLVDKNDLERDLKCQALYEKFGDVQELPMLIHARLGELKLLPPGVPVNSLKINDNSDLLILPNEAARVEAMYPELAGAPTETPGHSQEIPTEEYAIGNDDIEVESGLSINTFKKYAELAGIIIERTEGSNPKNKVKKSDIRRVIQFRKKY